MLSGALLRDVDEQAQRLENALRASEVLPDLTVDEDRVLEGPPEVRVAVGPDGAREILFRDLRAATPPRAQSDSRLRS